MCPRTINTTKRLAKLEKKLDYNNVNLIRTIKKLLGECKDRKRVVLCNNMRWAGSLLARFKHVFKYYYMWNSSPF